MRISIRFLPIIAAALLCFDPAHAEEDLAEAIASGTVSATFEAMGGSSGDVVMVTVRKVKDDGPDMTLTMRPGTRLKSGNADEQDMYIAGIKGIMMGGESYSPVTAIEASDASSTYVLDAYCAEFEKDNPSPGGKLSLAVVDPTAECILAKASKLSTSAKQAAVWIHTDKASYAEVKEKFHVSKPEWKAAVSVVKQCPLELKKSGRVK